MNHWKHLTEEVLPSWLERTPDSELGGIFS